MRIISQDGTLDIPYEQVIVQRFKERIYVLNKNLTGVEQLVDDMQIAMYSTEEKALKAMEMMKQAFLTRMELYGGYDYVSQCYVQPNYWVLPKVFQFPKDNEVVT